eukprot:CAMPEP_0171959066 /NCGR_PEP_ID=MMETSP0993-20121228/145046_1 /TAXON_ID=483369 /ORGANISM="non described non described, Strain CCMP2098" /LENGTH=256 /DNA_ID=CAMNT_0012606493 /DNA_START=21 /DNA_END=791 /DNA_ORIENTATION=+
MIRFLRHGQAAHNINAERMRKEGCTHEEFLQAMKQDDTFDSPLTQSGREQAQTAAMFPSTLHAAASVELVVASPLSRALDTADFVFPMRAYPKSTITPRICLEDISEIKGFFVSGKRRTTSELTNLYSAWDFSGIESDEDVEWERWGDTLESNESTQKRAHSVLCWLWQRPEKDIVVVGHGGIFKHLTNSHPLIASCPGMREQFGNCELRSCRLTLDEPKEASPFAGDMYFQLNIIRSDSNCVLNEGVAKIVSSST